MASEVTASIIPVTPSDLFPNGYELDESVVPSEVIDSYFDPNLNRVEFWIYDLSLNFLEGSSNFDGWYISNKSSTGENISLVNELSLDPVANLSSFGYSTGQLYTVYNFVNNELASSEDKQYYISEISSDRTELRLETNFITGEEIVKGFQDLTQKLDDPKYFDEFYLNFGNNDLIIGVNILLDTTGPEEYSILVKLYEPLPESFGLKDELYVVTKVAETSTFQVVFPNNVNVSSNLKYIQGPNVNLEIKDFVNNSTELKSKSELLSTTSSGSKDNLLNVLNQKGVKITPNYSYNTFNEFVNFSSAKKRIENFVEKLEQIQAYEADLDALATITGSTSASFQVSSSIASAYSKVEDIIKNFDGYEYYLYYNTSSLSYPKTGSSFPYTPLPTTDVSVSVWLGSDIEGSQYYGGILLSASLYDNNNQNWLYYTIPEFIRDNSDNNQYIEFSNMVGQHFDEIWLYTKAVSQRINTTSELEKGIPLKLAEEAVKSLGYQGFGNNYNNEGNYIGLTGENNGVYVPPTGSELITNYIAVNNGSIVNYWVLDYSYADYVQQLLDPGYPYPIDSVSKEIFKRLYHNMSYLVKKKGTISGLRQLINIWGIPNTILRINEFGGKNKDNSDDYDLWYNRYSYEFSPISTQHMPSASVVFPWMPLYRNYISSSEEIVPDSIQFRFKTTGYPSSSFGGEFFTQSLLVKKSDGDDTSTDFDFGIALFYTGSTSGSYSGSYTNEYNDWGLMRFYMSGSSADGGVAVSNDIYLPFFNKGWWSVMLQRNQHVSASDNNNATTYTLYAKNKIYNGFDGNTIGFEGSASITSNISESINDAWNKYGTGSADGVYLGGFISGSQVGGVTLNESGKIISGSLQEFRYYAYAISESIFNDFVMNPESIEGINLTGSLSSFDIVNFRAPLGNELESLFTSSLSSSYTESMTSMHPAITGAAAILVTESFYNPGTQVSSSNYDIIYYENSTLRTFSKTNTEVYFLDQPAVGLRNRISNKIQVADGSDYGTILSNQISIQQDYQISRSYTEDINSLEVAFSPQDEVNDDIIQTFGFGVVADSLADPRFLSESVDYYPQLRRTAEYYFQKYTKGNVYDYLRLIKYYDDSIFKAIKSYVPARTNVSTGIVIKQHLLERNRYPLPTLNETTTVARYASGSGANITYNNPINYENLELTSSISVGSFSGGAGGSANQYNVPAGYFRLQDNDPSSPYTLNSGSATRIFTNPTYSWIDTREDTFLDVSSSLIDLGNGFTNTDGEFTNYTTNDYTGNILFAVRNLNAGSGSVVANVEVALNEVGTGVIATQTRYLPLGTTVDYGFRDITFKSKKTYYFTLTSDANTVVRRLTAQFDNNASTNWGGQAYPDSNVNVTGLTEFTNHNESEFFDGEYSGSEFAATTQSLFNNPFTKPSTTETTYNFLVGEYGPILDYGNTKIDVKFWDSVIDTFETTVRPYNPGSGTGSAIWITQSANGVSTPQNYYEVVAIALLDSDGANTVIGGGWYEVGTEGNIYPSESYYWANQVTWDSAPMVRFDINGAISAGSVDTDTESSGIPLTDIVLQGLKIKQQDDLAASSGYGYRFYYTGDGEYLDTPGDQGSSRWILGTDPTFALSEGAYSSYLKYFSTAVLTFGGSGLGATSSLGYAIKNSASVSEGIVYYAPANYYHTGSELNRWKPFGLCLNAVDVNNNDNTSTLNYSGSQIEFALSASGTSFVDGTGLNSFIINSDYIPVLSKTYSSTNNSFLYKYNLLNTSRNNSRVGDETSLVSFDPYISSLGVNFENSVYYATPNNYNENRSNSFIYDVDYSTNATTATNRIAVISGSATPAEVPDSNYTMRRIINPRYDGCEVASADYNFYTPSTSSVNFLSGGSGSWGGDTTGGKFGKVAAVDKHPIYFAHFKNSKENYELWDSYTFRLDALIQVPSNDISGTNIVPKVYKLDGSNERLDEVSSIFEKGRNAIVAYDKNIFNGIDYSSLTVGSSEILQGGLEYNAVLTNEISEVEFKDTCSFISSSWGEMRYGTSYTTSPYVNLQLLSGGNEGRDYFLETGSGHFLLQGGGLLISSSYEPTSGIRVQQRGPGLGLVHTLNIAISNSLQLVANTGSTAVGRLGMPRSGSLPYKKLNPNLPSNYIRFAPISASGVDTYEDFDLPFIIKKGDEIRVTWNQTTATRALFETQDFIVTDVRTSASALSAAYGDDYNISTYNPIYNHDVFHSSIWNTIDVTPDPSTFNIPAGEVFNFTIRRRVNADDRAVIFQSPPSGSLGIKTPSGQGYLIPNDLSAVQKRNVQTIITQLKSRNLFLDTLDVEQTSST